jgi:hypothetical protein
MKITLLTATLIVGFTTLARGKDVTMTVNANSDYGAIVYSNTVSIASNEVATVTSVFGDWSAALLIQKDGITVNPFNGQGAGAVYVTNARLIVVAGPAVFTLIKISGLPLAVTLQIKPESFPPDKAIILPEGTVGIIHVESSTDLIQWKDEWTQTFSNTNQNRFFRLRADRVLP